MTILLRDARFGIRLLARNPGFTAVAVITLALGISATTAVFSVVYGTFFAPLPYRDADALVLLWSQYRGDRMPVATRDFLEWKRQATWSNAMAADRLYSALLGAFATVALMLAAVGIYGVMSFVVAQRTREIGVRMALGAGRGRMLVHVLREGMTTALAGTAVGGAGAFFVGPLMQGLVHGVDSTNPVPFLAVALVLLGAALLACLVPAHRAASVDPMVALRHD